MRCQTSVKTLPASKPPATLVAICRGMYMALITALMAAMFPTYPYSNLELERVLVWSGAVHLCRSDDRSDVLHSVGQGRGGRRIPRDDDPGQRRLSVRVGFEVPLHPRRQP